jgi:hypothetical protein|tara:strand:+ start:145 stop:408 length:264 start_codon:yes stop_codon:yes gene_type:complete
MKLNQTLVKSINQIDNLSDLIKLQRIVSEARQTLGRNTLSVGSRCVVHGSTKLKPHTGIIKKMQEKRAIVEINNMSYRIPYDMIEAV